MSLWSVLIKAVGGGLANDAAGDASSKGSKIASNQIRKGVKTTNANFALGSDIGDKSLSRIAELYGLEGYRTDAERAYVDYLSTKPPIPNATGWRSEADMTTKLISGEPVRGLIGDDAAAFMTLSPDKALANKLAYGWGDDKKAAAAARAKKKTRKAREKYTADLAAWQLQADKLKGESEKSLVGYDPAKARNDYLRATPGYGFRFDEGVRAVDASGSAKGDLLSGAQKMRLSEFGQGLASQELGSEFSRLMQLSGIGQNAATVKSNVVVGAGSNLANLSVAAGNQSARRMDNYNDIFQGAVGDYAYLNRRGDRGSSYDRNSPTDNPDYKPGQTLAPEDYN